MEKNYFECLKDTILFMPAMSIGNIGNITLDLMIINNKFNKIGYFQTNCLIPSVGRLPEINNSIENSLCLPGEIYTNGLYSILQIRSHLKEKKVRPFIDEIIKFIDLNKFKSVIVVGSASRDCAPDSEIINKNSRVFFIENSIPSLLKAIDINPASVLLDKNHEKINEFLGGSGLILRLKKNKELINKLPILYSFIFSSGGFDLAGSLTILETLAKNFKLKEKDFIIPKHIKILV